MPASNPYVISGIVRSGGSAVASVVVTAWNATRGVWLKGSGISTTNSAGEYSIDLNNFPGEVAYDNSDRIHVTAIRSDTKESSDFRFTVDTNIGVLERDIVLHAGETILSDSVVTSVTASNFTSSQTNFRLYDRETDMPIVSINLTSQSGNPTVNVHLGDGLRFPQGASRIFSDDTYDSTNSRTSMEATVTIKANL